MKKLEMIRVRSTPNATDEILSLLTDHINSLQEGSKSFEIKLMQHGRYYGDIAILIIWESAKNPNKSREGLLIAEVLQEIGALSHIVWLTDRT